MVITPPNNSLNSKGTDTELNTLIGNVAKLNKNVISTAKEMFGNNPNAVAIMLADAVTAKIAANKEPLT
jgi:hypothetical protein